jgi:hypothetical protein
MLARRLTTILPEVTLAEAIETTHIQCVAARTGRPHGPGHHPPVPRPPPHHPGRGADRRGPGADARRGVARAPRHALRGCAAGVPPPRARRAAPAPREWHHTYRITRRPRPRHLSCAASIDAHTDGPALAQITVRDEGCGPRRRSTLGQASPPGSEPIPRFAPISSPPAAGAHWPVGPLVPCPQSRNAPLPSSALKPLSRFFNGRRC